MKSTVTAPGPASAREAQWDVPRSPDVSVVDAITAAFADRGIVVRLHAREIGDSSAEICVGADEPVVVASVFKVLVAVEFARQVVAGQVDPSERVRVTASDRLGGVGTAGCSDDVDMSWRDLMLFAMSLSDNTAADLVLRRIGLDTVQLLAGELGLSRTRIIGGPRQTIEAMFVELGARDFADFAVKLPLLGPDQLSRLSVLDPARSNASTARDMTRLLSLVWTDRAGPAEACAMVRRLMREQASAARLASGFGEDVSVSAKSGTVFGIRNEIGVIAYPDGRRYAVAVFTGGGWGLRRPDVNAAIGRAARIAVDALRLGEPVREDDVPRFGAGDGAGAAG
jgi:beta-lactamase class A